LSFGRPGARPSPEPRCSRNAAYTLVRGSLALLRGGGRIGEDFVIWTPPDGGDEALGLVEFSIFPHVENPDLPTNTMAAAERWAAGLSGPAYAIDDETAIKVVDGTVEVVSEGHWKLFTRSAVATESGY
jgi:hypothetical protein